VGNAQIAHDGIEGGGNERAVGTSIRVEPRTPVTVRPVDERERTANQHLAIRLHGDSLHRATETQAGIEREVHITRRAVRLG
jgi:hypothetical protein